MLCDSEGFPSCSSMPSAEVLANEFPIISLDPPDIISLSQLNIGQSVVFCKEDVKVVYFVAYDKIQMPAPSLPNIDLAIIILIIAHKIKNLQITIVLENDYSFTRIYERTSTRMLRYRNLKTALAANQIDMKTLTLV